MSNTLNISKHLTQYADGMLKINAGFCTEFCLLIAFFFFVFGIGFLIVYNILHFYKKKLDIFSYIQFKHFLYIAAFIFQTLILASVFSGAVFCTVYWGVPFIMLYIGFLRYRNPFEYCIFSLSWEKIPLFFAVLTMCCLAVQCLFSFMAVHSQMEFLAVSLAGKHQYILDHVQPQDKVQSVSHREERASLDKGLAFLSQQNGEDSAYTAAYTDKGPFLAPSPKEKVFAEGEYISSLPEKRDTYLRRFASNTSTTLLQGNAAFETVKGSSEQALLLRSINGGGYDAKQFFSPSALHMMQDNRIHHVEKDITVFINGNSETAHVVCADPSRELNKAGYRVAKGAGCGKTICKIVGFFSSQLASEDMTCILKDSHGNEIPMSAKVALVPFKSPSSQPIFSVPSDSGTATPRTPPTPNNPRSFTPFN